MPLYALSIRLTDFLVHKIFERTSCIATLCYALPKHLQPRKAHSLEYVDRQARVRKSHLLAYLWRHGRVWPSRSQSFFLSQDSRCYQTLRPRVPAWSPPPAAVLRSSSLLPFDDTWLGSTTLSRSHRSPSNQALGRKREPHISSIMWSFPVR